MSFNENDLSVEQLLENVGKITTSESDIWSKSIAIANAKLGMENNQRTKRTQELTQEQIQVSNRANDLTEKLLFSNEQASKQNEKNAESMNQATKELARSTSSLNRATWVLVAVTAIQAIIAVLTFLKR